jgi:hypothetical protein
MNYFGQEISLKLRYEEQVRCVVKAHGKGRLFMTLPEMALTVQGLVSSVDLCAFEMRVQ